MFGTNKFEQAVKFYDVLMSEMGAEKVYGTDKNAGWGSCCCASKVEILLCRRIPLHSCSQPGNVGAV